MSAEREYRDRWMDYLDRLSRMGYQEFTVAEVINNLSGIPPMMSVFILDEDTDQKKFLNNIEITESEVPVLLMSVSKRPKSKRNPTISYEEKLAKKKALAEEMEKTNV